MNSFQSVEELKARYDKACDLKQVVDKPAITKAIREWIVAVGLPAETRVSFVSSLNKMLKVGQTIGTARNVKIAKIVKAVVDTRAAWRARSTPIGRAMWGVSEIILVKDMVAAVGMTRHFELLADKKGVPSKAEVLHETMKTLTRDATSEIEDRVSKVINFSRELARRLEIETGTLD